MICLHNCNGDLQVNLEYLARVVFNRDGLLYPDSVVGTDSHTTMVDGLGVAGWGVGGIEAEAVMLGQVIFVLLHVTMLERNNFVVVSLEGKTLLVFTHYNIVYFPCLYVANEYGSPWSCWLQIIRKVKKRCNSH